MDGHGRQAAAEREPGKNWLAEVEAVREPWFEMSIGGGWHHMDVAWNDNLEVPLAHIKNYIKMLEKGERIDRPVEEVEKERERVAAEYRGLITNDKDREIFDQRLALAKMVSIFPESHQFYIENWFHALFYRRAKELGQMFVSRGVLKDKGRHLLSEPLRDLSYSLRYPGLLVYRGAGNSHL